MIHSVVDPQLVPAFLEDSCLLRANLSLRSVTIDTPKLALLFDHHLTH